MILRPSVRFVLLHEPLVQIVHPTPAPASLLILGENIPPLGDVRFAPTSRHEVSSVSSPSSEAPDSAPAAASTLFQIVIK